MSNAVEISHVSKKYKEFSLRDVSLEIKQGYITGLIGPNGAGKSTLIKMLLHMVRPDQGDIKLFGLPMPEREQEIKTRIGYVSDESHYYEHLKALELKRIVAPFYTNWQEGAYRSFVERFELPSKTKIKDYSKGMKMKLALAIALSHEADMLIMDEPTAGLDPVFRREMLDLLAGIILDENKTVLFSTHITTDLDRVADYIAFLNRGRLVFSEAKDAILDSYALVKGGRELLDSDVRKEFVGIRETGVGFEGLTRNRTEAERRFSRLGVIESPTLEDIVFYTVKGGTLHAS